jgi:hypothetical protein
LGVAFPLIAPQRPLAARLSSFASLRTISPSSSASAHRIAVMHLGKIVEYTDKQTPFTNPLHP